MDYVDKDKLLKEIELYKETGIKSEELGRMVLLIATRYSERGNFSGYTWKDDMIGEAVFTCLKYIHNFDPEKENSNPFAYISIIVHRAFLNYIAKQKKHSSIKDECYKYAFMYENDFLIRPYEKDYFRTSGINYQIIKGMTSKKRKKKKKKKKK